MVTRLGVQRLILLIWSLVYIRERSRSASVITPHQNVQVKGPSYILDNLRQANALLDWLLRGWPHLQPVKTSMTEWVAYLDKKYGEKFVFGGPPVILDANDGGRLDVDAQSWTQQIFAAFNDYGTVMLNEGNIGAIFPDEVALGLDKATLDDLNDGISALLHLLPTPAAMILFRVAENTFRSYYARVMKKDPGKAGWAELLEEMERGNLVKKSILGYLQYLKDKRNEAEHPDKRFTQEEAERILLQVKGLLEETRAK
jgi:hypothetical protein